MFLVRVIRYVTLLVLAGILSPRDFGILAALHVVIDGIVLLQGFGIGHALIYRKERIEEATDTAFYVSMALGAAAVAVAWVLAPAVERFYAEDGMTELFRVGSVLLLGRALRLIPARLFEKALEFKKRLAPTLAGSVAYLVVALVLAFRGAGVWALLWAEIASVFAEATGYWIVSPWRPRLRFSPELAREDLSFGWVVLGGSALIFAFRNVDRLTLSRLLGTRELGLYAFAFSIANLPATFFVRALNTVLLPSYTSARDDVATRRTLFFRATSYVAAASLLYALVMVVFGRSFLVATYGDRWLGSVRPLQVLALFALFRTLSALVGDLLVGCGRPGTFRRIYALQLAVALACIYFGARAWGTWGVGLAMALAAAVALGASWHAARTALDATVGDFVHALRGPLLASVVMIGPAVALMRALPEPFGLPAVGAAALAVSAGYLLVWLAVDPEPRAEWRKWRESRNGPEGEVRA